MSKRNLTTSILGDAGSAEASVVPNLESLNTGSDAYVTSISDTSEFNVFQQLKIYDNYWETLFGRHIISAANAGAAPDLLSQVNIQGNTEGWTRADHMCLMVPVQFTYNYNYTKCTSDELVTATVTAAQNKHDAATSGTTPFDWEGVHSIINNAAITFSHHNLKIFKHAWIGVLDIFERLRMLVGNNGQMLQKQIETEPIGMKYHISTLRCGKVLQKAIGEWGIPNVIGFDLMDTTQALLATIQPFGSAYWGGTDNRLMWSRNRDAVLELAYQDNDHNEEDAALNYFRMISSISSVSNYDSRQLLRGIAGSTNRIVQVTRTRNLTLPLQAIIPFFRGAKFLPPDFRFKFEIEVNSGRMIMKQSPLVSNLNQMSQAAFEGNDPRCSYGEVKAKCNASGIELHYPYHILRQPVQAAISAMWLQKPFLYNYETIQSTEIIPTQGSNYVNFTISISTQRPTVLDAFLFPLQSMTDWETDYKQVLPWNDENNSVATGYRIKNTPHVHGDVDASASTKDKKNDALAGPTAWSDCEIMFSGRTAYRFLNNYVTTHGHGNDSIQPYELFLQLFDEQSFRSCATEYNATSHVERNPMNTALVQNNQKSHKLLRVIIQPGGWADRGVISSRQGATTITMNMNFKRPLSASDRFVVIRTNPEQLVFDSDKNVTIIQWPAIKSNMGYLIPNITAAP